MNISEINREKYSKITIFLHSIYLAFFLILQYDYSNITKGELINVKKVLIHARRSLKLVILLIIAAFLIVGLVAYFFKPTYRVVLNNEPIGYTVDKGKLQAKINDYIKNGDGQNVAFVQVDQMPEYQLCLLKRGIVPNDNEIYDKIKNAGTTYYRYYAILENQEEKVYVSTFAEAENVVNMLKEKESNNMESIAISEKYEVENKEFVTEEDAVAKLYVEKPKEETPQVQVAKANNIVTSKKATGTVNTGFNISGSKVSLGISLIKPISGIITSRFAESSRIRSSRHTGLDISASTGTPIKAASSGTVTFSGRKGSYGNLLVITHGNGVQTYYGHCSALYASVGQTVSQGQVVAAVGSTGNSTGPHLHLEIRVKGVAYNPQNYLY